MVVFSKFIIIGAAVSVIVILTIFIILNSNEFEQNSSNITKTSPSNITKTSLISEVKFLGIIETFGREEGQLDTPSGIQFFNNQLFVIDTGNNRIQIFSEDLDFKSMIDLSQYQFGVPRGIAVTSDKIFVAYDPLVNLSGMYEIHSFDYDGDLLSKFPISWTTDLEADEDFVYVLEPHRRAIQIYDHVGTFTNKFEAHENVHYINSNQNKLILSGPHPSVNISPEVMIYDKNSGVLEKRFPTDGLATGSAITENNVFLLESDIIKIFDFDGNLIYEHDLEIGISDTQYYEIEINDNIVYVSDEIGHSIQILKLIYE